MESEEKEVQQEVEKVIKKPEFDFNKLQDRRGYIQSNPEMFPEMVQKFLLNHEPYKDGVSWFAYHLATDVSTRHEAHWQLQSFVLLEIWGLLKELVEGNKKQGAEVVESEKAAGVRRRR